MSKQDYLTEDPIISSQKYYCVSFFNKFNVKQSIENNNDNKKEILNNDNKELNGEIESYSTDDNILGFKIRGGFPTLEEARSHAKRLSEIDPYHHIYVMEGGKWCAFIMKESDTNNFVEQTEYANDQLNDMMKQYVDNQEKAKVYHELRKNDLIIKNLQENIDSRTINKEETHELLSASTNKEEKSTIKNKLLAIDEQIETMEKKKKELKEQEEVLMKKIKSDN